MRLLELLPSGAYLTLPGNGVQDERVFEFRKNRDVQSGVFSRTVRLSTEPHVKSRTTSFS